MAAPAPQIRGVILAAGASRRFGPDNKLLAAFRGRPVLAHVLELVTQACGRPLVVVPGAGPVQDLALGHRAEPLLNARAAEGMGTSLACAAAHLLTADPETGGLAVFLGDMPLIRPETVTAVCDALAPPETLIARPVHGRPGHPVVFHRQLLADLSTLTGDEGARQVVARHAGHIASVPVEDPGIHRDIDVPEDLGPLQTRGTPKDGAR